MGSCSSLHKLRESNSAADRSTKTGDAVSLKPQSPETTNASIYNDFCKEDVYFDTNLFMDSDCEDFFSVNGDLTPSNCTTPVHQSSHIEDLSNIEGQSIFKHETPPTDTRQLLELFRENPNTNFTIDKPLHEKLEGKPQIKQYPKRKSSRPATCCLPSLVRSLSGREKRLNTTECGAG